MECSALLEAACVEATALTDSVPAELSDWGGAIRP
jgi:hypothetical protein